MVNLCKVTLQKERNTIKKPHVLFGVAFFGIFCHVIFFVPQKTWREKQPFGDFGEVMIELAMPTALTLKTIWCLEDPMFSRWKALFVCTNEKRTLGVFHVLFGFGVFFFNRRWIPNQT